MNLVEFPFATLSRRPSLGSLTCVRWISDGQGGRRRQSWSVQGGSASGLPTEFDERVYVALLALTQRAGYVQRKVPISVYRILTLMGESTDSKHYRSVERSLERLLRASIVAEGAFWDAGQKRLVQRVNGFHLIERYWLAYREADPEVANAEGVPGYVVWGEEVWHSLQRGYLKPLDLKAFFALQTPMARRLYRFLDKKLHRASRFEIDIFQLSQQLGMAWYRYPAKVKEKLQPGIDELVGCGFLAQGEVIKVGGYTRLRFIRGASATAAIGSKETSATAPALAPGDLEALAREWRREAAGRAGIDDAMAELWEQALGLLREQVSATAYGTWLARTLLIALDGRQVAVAVPNAFLQEHLAARYADRIAVALHALLRSDVAVSFRVLAL
jgi:plasmid replication initiation protein